MKSLSFKEMCVELAKNRGWRLEAITDSTVFYWVYWLESTKWNSLEEIEREALFVDEKRALISFNEDQVKRLYHEFYQTIHHAIQTDEVSKALFEARQQMSDYFKIENILDIDNFMFLTNFDMENDFPVYETSVFYEGRGEGEHFTYDGWDIEKLHKLNKNIQPPYGLDWEDLKFLTEGSFLLVVHNGKFYNESCIEGVENIFELPVYRGLIKEYAIKKKKL